jgi:pyridoxal phosphate enzyme (YggS family)
MAELDPTRFDQLAQNLAHLKLQIDDTALAANRDPADIKLIAVTKGFPASDLLALHQLGVTDFGESKDQEVRAKLPVLSGISPQLHFIGQLQRNKLKSIISYSSVIHSVDRPELVAALVKLKADTNTFPAIMLQVDLADRTNPNRGGVTADGLVELAELAHGAGITVLGLMAVAPLGEVASNAFAKFDQIANQFCEFFPTATARSIGMSGDWQTAVSYGATHLRIGAALLGNRG